MRKYGKTDSNQTEIVSKLRQLGVSVFSTASMGDGFPDIVVGSKGVNYLIELKDGKKPPSQRKLTADEIKFHNSWKGSVHVANSFEECLEVIKI